MSQPLQHPVTNSTVKGDPRSKPDVASSPLPAANPETRRPEKSESTSPEERSDEPEAPPELDPQQPAEITDSEEPPAL